MSRTYRQPIDARVLSSTISGFASEGFAFGDETAPVIENNAGAASLESQGWQVWLTTLFPFAFDEDFSDEHIQFWTLYWSVLLRIRVQQKYIKLGLPIPTECEISDSEYVLLLVLGRGLGKSQTLEASSVMRGAILNGGYCLYVCEAQDQANEHVGNCRDLIEHEESRLSEYYPSMAEPQKRRLGKANEKWSEDLFVCANGWICRGKGLNSRLRGLRIGRRRPDDINVDDIDGVNDSIALSFTKLRQLSSSVFPTQARMHATIKFGQNLITEHSVMNQIYTGKTDALAARTPIGVTKTFVNFDYETYLDEKTQLTRHRILSTSIPSWSGVDIPRAQKFLNDSGLDTFLAEYQNEFEHQRQGKVIHAYDEERHVITWSMFQKVFNVRYIPPHWNCEAGADIGYTVNSLSAWTFRATAAKDSRLPNKKFIYRGLTFEAQSIDDQAIRLWTEMFPDPQVGRRHFEATTDFGGYPELLRLLRVNPRLEPYLTEYKLNPIENRYRIDKLDYSEVAAQLLISQIRVMVLSHEKSGEQKTMAQKYGLPVRKTKDFGATDGVAEWNHLLRGDYTKPHPFKDDELLPDGTYRLGCPELFYLVDDDQYKAPHDDRGLKTHRESVSAWEYTKEKLTELGMTEAKPLKYKSDTCDSERMLHARNWGHATPLTKAQAIEARLSPQLQTAAIANVEDPEKRGKLLQAQMMQRKVIEQKMKPKSGNSLETYRSLMRER